MLREVSTFSVHPITGFVSSALCQNIGGKGNVTACYTVDENEYCFYTDGSELRWNEAREFCARRNWTLPIISNENIDSVFQRFIVNDSYNMMRDRNVWIDARANLIDDSVPWQWINGQRSGLVSLRLDQDYYCSQVLR